jgi:hypothetical protein
MNSIKKITIFEGDFYIYLNEKTSLSESIRALRRYWNNSVYDSGVYGYHTKYYILFFVL